MKNACTRVNRVGDFIERLRAERLEKTDGESETVEAKVCYGISLHAGSVMQAEGP